jgi:hypothetical protein
MKQTSMRPAIFLLLALVLSAPTLLNIVAGSESAMATLVHLGGAILVARIAVQVVSHLVDSYRLSAARRAQQNHHQ